MNFYKITPLTKQVYQRGVRYQSRHPDVDYTHVNRYQMHNIDVVEVQKWRKQREEDYREGRIYTGGDQEDRLDYIKEQKARLGQGFERMMAFSNKRAPKSKYLNYEMPYIEFNRFDKEILAPYEVFRPADMGWSAREFISIIDSGAQSDLEQEAFMRVKPDLDQALDEMDEISKYVFGVDPHADEENEKMEQIAAEKRKELYSVLDEKPLRTLANSEHVSDYLRACWDKKGLTAEQVYAELESMHKQSITNMDQQIEILEKQVKVDPDRQARYFLDGLKETKEYISENDRGDEIKPVMMAEIEQWLAYRPSLRGPGKKKVKGSRKNKK